MIPNKSKVFLISHKEDIDGIVSAALLYSDLRKKGYEYDEIDIHLIDYTSIINFIEINIEELSSHTIYLSDIGINKRLYHLLLQFSPIETLPEGVYRYYYDHHAISNDVFEIKQELKKRFHVYKNSYFDQSLINYCTAEIIYDSLKYDDSHFKSLCEYAHIGDFKQEGYGGHIKLANELKMFISYYQNMNSKLVDLVLGMQTTETWKSYQESFTHSIGEINAWFKIQYEQVKNNIIRINGDSHTIIISIADLKAEDIVYYLMKNYPGYDIYCGFSRRNNYANIQTGLNIAHIIASHFGGGGHPNRAGFKIPDEIQNYIDNEQFHYIIKSLFIEQLKLILSEVET